MQKPQLFFSGNGLLLSSGKKWARNRRLLTNAFHFDVLKPYLSVYAEAADVLVVSALSVLQCCSTLHHYLVQDQWSKQEGQSFDIVPYMKHYTLDVMLRCACSYESNCQITGLVLATCNSLCYKNI